MLMTASFCVLQRAGMWIILRAGRCEGTHDACGVTRASARSSTCSPHVVTHGSVIFPSPRSCFAFYCRSDGESTNHAGSAQGRSRAPCPSCETTRSRHLDDGAFSRPRGGEVFAGRVRLGRVWSLAGQRASIVVSAPLRPATAQASIITTQRRDVAGTRGRIFEILCGSRAVARRWLRPLSTTLCGVSRRKQRADCKHARKVAYCHCDCFCC